MAGLRGIGVGDLDGEGGAVGQRADRRHDQLVAVALGLGGGAVHRHLAQGVARAPITFEITTPPGLDAVANGELVDREEQADGRVRWTYDSRQPVSTQLVQLAIGRFTFDDRTGPHGLPIRESRTPWPRPPPGRTAGTQDYVRLASKVAGRDLTSFLGPWLYGAKTPPMPGHPDWVVDPVVAP